MNSRTIFSTIVALFIVSLAMGRVISANDTFLATSNNSIERNKEQQDTIRWMARVNPLDFATYKYSYSLPDDPDDAPLHNKLVKYFAGSFHFPDNEGYSVINGSYIADLNGDGVEEGVVIRMTNTGGTGKFPDLVVLKKIGDEFTEFASTNEPTSFFNDRIQVKSVIVQKGVITVDILGKGPNDGGCCATQPMKMSFHLVGDQLKPLITE